MADLLAVPRAVPLVLPTPSAGWWDAQQAPRCEAAGCNVSVGGRRRFCSARCQKRTTQNAPRAAARAARVWPCEHCGSPIRGGRSTRRFCGDTCRWRFRNARRARPAPTDSADWLARFDAAARRWDEAHGRSRHPWSKG